MWVCCWLLLVEVFEFFELLGRCCIEWLWVWREWWWWCCCVEGFCLLGFFRVGDGFVILVEERVVFGGEGFDVVWVVFWDWLEWIWCWDCSSGVVGCRFFLYFDWCFLVCCFWSFLCCWFCISWFIFLGFCLFFLVLVGVLFWWFSWSCVRCLGKSLLGFCMVWVFWLCLLEVLVCWWSLGWMVKSCRVLVGCLLRWWFGFCLVEVLWFLCVSLSGWCCGLLVLLCWLWLLVILFFISCFEVVFKRSGVGNFWFFYWFFFEELVECLVMCWGFCFWECKMVFREMVLLEMGFYGIVCFGMLLVGV